MCKSGFRMPIIVLSLSLLLTACVMPPPSTQQEGSAIVPLRLEVPTIAGKKAATPFMVAFVDRNSDPLQNMTASALKAIQRHPTVIDELVSNQKFATVNVEYVFVSRPNESIKKMQHTATDYPDKLRKYLRADLKRILIGENIKVLGDFRSLDEMTFDEKKRAIYAFTPEIVVKIDTKHTSERTQSKYDETGEVIVYGDAILALRESLTGELLWIKRFEVGPFVKPYKVSIESTTSSSTSAGSSGTTTITKSEDDTDRVLAATLSDFYTNLIKELTRQIDPEEWERYLDEAETVRKAKRY